MFILCLRSSKYCLATCSMLNSTLTKPGSRAFSEKYVLWLYSKTPYPIGIRKIKATPIKNKNKFSILFIVCMYISYYNLALLVQESLSNFCSNLHKTSGLCNTYYNLYLLFWHALTCFDLTNYFGGDKFSWLPSKNKMTHEKTYFLTNFALLFC